MKTAFHRGEFVRVTYGANTIDAMVMLSLSNGKSLMLGFADTLKSPIGTVFPGVLPLIMGEDGVYRDIVENEPAQVRHREHRE